MNKKKKDWFEPIDLGLGEINLGLGEGKGFVIDLGLPKMEPCVPDVKDPKKEDNSLIFGLGGFAGDISKTIHDTKKDYDQFKESTKLMKQDLTPAAKKTIGVARRVINWLKNLKHYKDKSTP